MRLFPLEVRALLTAGIDVLSFEAGTLRGGRRTEAHRLLSRLRSRPRRVYSETGAAIVGNTTSMSGAHDVWRANERWARKAEGR